MKYTIIKPQIKSGDLFAWRKAGPLSKLVRMVTFSTYSHVGIAWRFRDRVFILQDKEGMGITLVALSENLPCDYIATNAQWTDETEAFAIAHLGQKYSYYNALRASLGLQPVGKDRICSEYATSILKLAKVLDGKQSTLTPGKLVEQLLNQGLSLKKVDEND